DILSAGRVGETPTSRSTPSVVPVRPGFSNNSGAILDQLLELPQPGAEFSRLHEESLRRALGKDTEAVLQQAALDRKRRLSQRLRAVRLVAPEFDELSESFVKRMAKDASWEIRSQAAWLIGIRLRTDETPTLLTLLADKDAFV